MRVWWAFWILIGGCDNSLPDDPAQDGDGSFTPEQDADADTDTDADADADADADVDQEDIAIEGSWASETHAFVIQNTTISTLNLQTMESSDTEIAAYDNWKKYLITSADGYESVRTDWFIGSSRELHLCTNQIPGTPEDLAERPQPNTSNASMGCHGDPWLETRTPIDIRGEWANHEETMTITEFAVNLGDEHGSFEVTSANQDAAVLFTDGMYYWDGLFEDQPVLVSWIWRTDEYLACFSPEALWDGPEIDETNLQTGCSGRQWWPLREPISVRGKYQPIGLLPTHLFEVDSATVISYTTIDGEEATLSARWRTKAIDRDQQTMVLHMVEADDEYEGPIEIPTSSRYIKIQWATDDPTGDQYLCLLASGHSEASVSSTPAESFDLGQSCGISDLSSQEGWNRLEPAD